MLLVEWQIARILHVVSNKTLRRGCLEEQDELYLKKLNRKKVATLS